MRSLKKYPLRANEQPTGYTVRVDEETTLLPFLLKKLSGQSRTSIKNLLGKRFIWLNGNIITQFDAPLKKGDVILVSNRKAPIKFNNPLLNIIWEDSHLILINKKEGLLSVETTRERERTAYHILSDYLKKQDPRSKLYILHRLDKDTSGLLMFAKSIGVKDTMQNNWSTFITQRTYVAVVEGTLEQKEGTIRSFLKENNQMQVLATTQEEGKEAVSRYKVLKENKKYSLVSVTLETGRKNQIRTQFQSIGHSIVGDNKYGAETDPVNRLMLHAQRLHFIHPITHEEMKFDTKIPDAFLSLVR